MSQAQGQTPDMARKDGLRPFHAGGTALAVSGMDMAGVRPLTCPEEAA
jgi:hypothetical protein